MDRPTKAVPATSDGVDDSGWSAASDRLRERCELAAGTLRGTPAGDRGAAGDRREPRPHRPAI